MTDRMNRMPMTRMPYDYDLYLNHIISCICIMQLGLDDQRNHMSLYLTFTSRLAVSHRVLNMVAQLHISQTQTQFNNQSSQYQVIIMSPPPYIVIDKWSQIHFVSHRSGSNGETKSPKQGCRAEAPTFGIRLVLLYGEPHRCAIPTYSKGDRQASCSRSTCCTGEMETASEHMLGVGVSS